jgi:hypothetical protein
VKKIARKVLFWRHKTHTKEEIAAEEEYFNEDDNNIENIEAEKEYLESKALWVRGASRISNQVSILYSLENFLNLFNNEKFVLHDSYKLLKRFKASLI